jgi:hypothetical protein
MSRGQARRSPPRDEGRRAATVEAPLVWTFDGPFSTCLFDMEDTLRRSIVQVGDVSRIAVMIELSLPALRRRVQLGDAVQPAWGRFLDALTRRYGLPSAPRLHPVRAQGPLATLWIAYRS